MSQEEENQAPNQKPPLEAEIIGPGEAEIISHARPIESAEGEIIDNETPQRGPQDQAHAQFRFNNGRSKGKRSSPLCCGSCLGIILFAMALVFLACYGLFTLLAN